MSGLLYCHAIDVGLAVAGEFEETDALGALVKESRIKREIETQSGLIRAILRVEFGANLFNYDFWHTSPISHPANGAGDVELAKATMPSTFNMQQLTLKFLDADNYSITGSVSGVIQASQAKASDYNLGGLVILAADWSGTAAADDKVYILGYTVDPIIAGICAKLVATQLVKELVQRHAMDSDLKIIRDMRKEYLQHLYDIRDGKSDLGGRQYQDIGRWINLPSWNIDELGKDVSKYRRFADNYQTDLD